MSKITRNNSKLTAPLSQRTLNGRLAALPFLNVHPLGCCLLSELSPHAVNLAFSITLQI